MARVAPVLATPPWLRLNTGRSIVTAGPADVGLFRFASPATCRFVSPAAPVGYPFLRVSVVRIPLRGVERTLTCGDDASNVGRTNPIIVRRHCFRLGLLIVHRHTKSKLGNLPSESREHPTNCSLRNSKHSLY